MLKRILAAALTLSIAAGVFMSAALLTAADPAEPAVSLCDFDFDREDS